MTLLVAIGISILLCTISHINANFTKCKGKIALRFADDFQFGVSTAAYQIEGGWNDDGKGWSTWDHLVRTDPNYIDGRTNGDIAANSYHHYKRDIEMLKELGVANYRFSISWPRIFPNGKPNHINPYGIAYYNALINELLDNGIEPFPTIYHFDLPQNLAEQGGLLNEDFPEWFGNYAKVLYENFGDRVKYWMTINEPYVHCYFAYSIGMHPPRIRSPDVGFYECGRQSLLAHARAFHIYGEEFKASQGGQVGIILNMDWAIPSSNSRDDADAFLSYFAFKFGHYMDPIFSKQGNYPQLMIDQVAAASAKQGLKSSKLRSFTQEQIDYIRGTSDFLALNHYTTDIVYRNESVVGINMIPTDDVFLATYKDPSWPTSSNIWLREYPPGLYKLLLYIRDTYNNPNIYITENGISSPKGLTDDGRVQYFRNYLSALQDALAEGVNVIGYFAWSLMDNFEWTAGYTHKFGLYEVDMEDPNRTRTPRKSALVYKEIIRSRVIDYNFNPDPRSGAVSFDASVVSVAAIFNLVRYFLNVI